LHHPIVAGPLAVIDEVSQIVNVIAPGCDQRIDQQADLILRPAPMLERVDDAQLALE
jgi:hypothetical protein